MATSTSPSPIAFVKDFEPYLKESVSELWWQYYRSGTHPEQTLRDNQLAFQRYRLRPRCLRDVSSRDTSTTILGHHLDFPVGVSPTACHAIVHPDGEVATAKGVASVGSVMVLSMWANRTLEDTAAAVPPETPMFQNLNFVCERETSKRLILPIESLVRRAERAGFKALVVTVDMPGVKREANFRNPVALLPRYLYPQLVLGAGDGDSDEPLPIMMDPSVTWDDIKWLRNFTSLPIILKGILTGEDAEEAVRHGVAGIMVSNHGGRQLDGVSASIDALPEVANAVRGSNVEVYLDGGIRTGTDVLKALALGARAVFIGRPAIWGLAYDGEAGVRSVLQIIKEELSTAMALTGCSSLADITPDLITTAPSIKPNSHGV